MSVRFPSLRFPSPTPIWARSCLVHLKQEGILEVLRATGIQHLLVPLHVLSDKSFTSWIMLYKHVCVRQESVFKMPGEISNSYRVADKAPEPIILAGLVL